MYLKAVGRRSRGRAIDIVQKLTLSVMMQRVSYDELRIDPALGSGGAVRIEPDLLLTLDYLDYAAQFFEAFNKLPERHPPPSWPRYFFLCHSIELALKAYLTLRGVNPEQLRYQDRRHNLDKLLNEAVEKGLNLTTRRRQRLRP